MGIGSILSGASAIASLAGGFTGNKQKAMPGAQTRPMADSLKDIDKLRAWLEQNTQYINRPTRRLTAPELEGPFAPVAVREIQNYFDHKYPNRGGEMTDDAATMQQDPASMFTPQDDVFIKQYEYGQIPQKQYAMQYQDAIKRREAAGKVPMPMGGYMPSNNPQQTQPGLTAAEIEMLRTMMGAQSGNR